METCLEINGINLELDLLDADVLERYQKSVNDVVEETQAVESDEGMSVPDKMRRICRLLDGFFDEMFGEGTAVQLFGQNNNMGLRYEAFGKATNYARASQERVSEITNQYSPQRVAGMNRQQRRAQQYGPGMSAQTAQRPTAKPKPAAPLNIAQYSPQYPAQAQQEKTSYVSQDGIPLVDDLVDGPQPVGMTQEQFEQAIRIARKSGIDLSGGNQ